MGLFRPASAVMCLVRDGSGTKDLFLPGSFLDCVMKFRNTGTCMYTFIIHTWS